MIASWQQIEAGEVATVAVLGWIGGTISFTTGYLLLMIVSAGLTDSSIVLFTIQAIPVMSLGVGLISAFLVLPAAFGLIWLLRSLSTPRPLAASMIVVTATAFGLSFRQLGDEWLFLSRFWFAALPFGMATAYAYMRVIDA